MKFILIFLSLILVVILIKGNPFYPEKSKFEILAEAALIAKANKACYTKIRTMLNLPSSYNFDQFDGEYDRFGPEGIKLTINFNLHQNRKMPRKAICRAIDGKLLLQDGVQFIE